VTDNVIGASGVMVARAALDQVGGFAENRDRFRIDVEDWELWLRIARRWKVGLARSVVYGYRRHDSNSSTDLDSLDAAYAHFLDTAFADVTAEQAALRPRATAKIQMILAWQCLNERHEPAAALARLRNAVRAWPAVRRSAEYWRLRGAATVLRVTGRMGYAALRGANGAVRRLRSRNTPTG
jgi:hypothetical protein